MAGEPEAPAVVGCIGAAEPAAALVPPVAVIAVVPPVDTAAPAPLAPDAAGIPACIAAEFPVAGIVLLGWLAAGAPVLGIADIWLIGGVFDVDVEEPPHA